MVYRKIWIIDTNYPCKKEQMRATLYGKKPGTLHSRKTQMSAVHTSKTHTASTDQGFEEKRDIFTDLASVRVGELSPFSSDIFRNLRWSNGNYVINDENRYLAYELYFAIQFKELSRVYPLQINRKISSVENSFEQLVELFKTLDETYYTYSSAILQTFLYSDELLMFLADIDGVRNALTAVQGVDPCRQCGSYNTLAVSVQTRSADEPETRFVKCLTCGESWKES
jgi:DNA-directed RNA polymerase subunit M/transcription elongation factor TFIIS